MTDVTMPAFGKKLFVHIAMIAGITATCLAIGGAVEAYAQSPLASTPSSAFFVGAGVGGSFVDFGSQSVYNKGLSDVFNGGTLVATGQADGPPVQSRFKSQANAVPVLQFGYFRHFGDSDWLWGAKFSYIYVGTHSSVQNMVIPQFGTSSNQSVSSFTGYSVTGSYDVAIHHQTTLMPFIGRSFDKGFFYMGAGPSLSEVQASLDGVVGYATINGTLTNISGDPQSFSSTNWTLGVAATAGMTYFLAPQWFVDLNYIFSMPRGSTIHATSPFNNPGGGGASFSGTLIGTYTANLTSHTLSITINRIF